MRRSIYCTFGLPSEYYVPGVVNMFLDDIYYYLLKYNIIMAFKKKREVGHLHSAYTDKIRYLDKQQYFFLINPDIQPQELILSSIGVISLPFTSTAIIAKDLNIPSVYYDPSGVIARNQSTYHGVSVIGDIAELSHWISRLEG